MGLDMYLKGKRYISSVFRKEDAELAEAVQKLFPELADRRGRWGDAACVQEVQIDAGYWRKANAIHDWFVKNVQDGEDECRPHYVSRENLKDLKDACEAVLADKTRAPELLPTTGGFFFGSTEYDEYYFQDLEQTIGIIDQCFELPLDWEFEYRSSW